MAERLKPESILPQAEKPERAAGRILGFVFSYLLFTVALYFAINRFGRNPEPWSLLQVALLSSALALVGWAIGRILR